MAPLLEIKKLDVHYGAVHALKGVDITVEEKQIVTLIGANGAGKSTTLRSINGIVHPRRGSIRFEGRDITRTAPHTIVKQGIAQSPEGRRLFPRMTVTENLEMGAYTRTDREIAADMDQVFAIFPRLAERRAQVAGTLSGGEQQMLAIGRALMARPRLLLLDEPSLGLAPRLVDEVFAALARLRQEGLTLLLVEQMAEAALGIADRGYVLEQGRIVLEGTAGELLRNERVAHAYLGRLAGATVRPE